MKKFYLNGTGAVLFDPETDKIENTPLSRTAVRDAFLIEEPTQVIYEYGSKHVELFAEPDDIVVMFYNGVYEVPLVIVKSAIWTDNMKKYRDDEQKRKEEWAAKKLADSANDADVASVD